MPAYRFRFGERVTLRDAENTLLLAVVAADGIFGEARVRMDGGFIIDPPIRVIVVDASTAVGQVVASVFNELCRWEFGREAFDVRRVELIVQGGAA